MDEKTAIKYSKDWVRLQSKSRPNHHYMFNKQTGETRWCKQLSSNEPQNISVIKCNMKTPAQDRLKRLQNNLEKIRHKDGTKSKKLNFSDKLILEAKKDSSKVNKPSPPANKEASISKKSQITDEKNQGNVAKLTIEKNKPQINLEKAACSAAKDQSNAIQLEKNKFRIPKKPSSPPQNTSKTKAEKRKHDDDTSVASSTSLAKQLPNKATSNVAVLKKEIANVSSPKKMRKSNEFKDGDEKTQPDAKNKVKCDINENVEPSNDQKSTIMSVIKDYCSSVFKKVIHTNKVNNPENDVKTSNLSHHSKPSFKSKQPLRKVSSPDLRLSGSANERLNRLRKSLQSQQTISNHTQSILSPSSSVCSLNASDVCTPSTSLLESESMDWQPILEDSPFVTSSSFLSNVSPPNVSTSSEHFDTVNENLLRLAADKKQQEKQWKFDFFYFIVDTNVFLENITFVEELTTMKLCDTSGTLIYVPYCVLQELDKLKIRSPSESIKTRSTRAIKFLNKAFETRAQNIQAQSSADENKHLIKVKSPDDSILNCCLQVKEHINNVLLLTEDINLRNKAMCSDILVSTKSDLISKHESLL